MSYTTNRYHPAPRRQPRPPQHLGHAHATQPARRNRLVSIAAGLALALTTAIASAGQARVADFVINYNALHSTNLTPEIARRTGITRRDNNVVILVNVQHDDAGTTHNAVPAKVTGTARELLGNRKDLAFREVREAGGIDYMAQTTIIDEQTLIFDLVVTPEDGPTKSLQFQHVFYVQ